MDQWHLGIPDHLIRSLFIIQKRGTKLAGSLESVYYQSQQSTNNLLIHLNIHVFDLIVGIFEIHLVRQDLVNVVLNAAPVNTWLYFWSSKITWPALPGNSSTIYQYWEFTINLSGIVYISLHLLVLETIITLWPFMISIYNITPGLYTAILYATYTTKKTHIFLSIIQILWEETLIIYRICGNCMIYLHAM